MNGKTMVEVGSGRGGGLIHLNKVLKPKEAFGVDLCGANISYCLDRYNDIKNLKFVEGDSTRLNEVKELKENSLDLIFNIESSHCYNDIERFFAGVNRLLKPDGTFVYVDWRFTEMIPAMEEALKRQFTIEKYEDISENVISALKASSEFK